MKAIPIGFMRANPNGTERESFIHAKFYGISTRHNTTVLGGSANCSRAALTIPGKKGNAELLAIQQMSHSEFQSSYLDEISILEDSLELPDSNQNDEPPLSDHKIRILAASYDNGFLQIAYKCASDVEVTRCLIDQIEYQFTKEATGTILIETPNPPKCVQLEVSNGLVMVASELFWVDVEPELRTTSRGRTMAGVVRQKVQAHNWGIDGWKEILDVFCKHLKYLPPRGSWREHRKNNKDVKTTAEFTAEDVFSTTYGLPSLGSAIRGGLVVDRTQSLQKMLLRWFGIQPLGETDPEEIAEAAAEDDTEDDVVDRPEQLPSNKNPARNIEATTSTDRKKAKMATQQMSQAMAEESFLAKRPPELLAADLKIAAVLLRTGLRKGWIDGPEFFDATRLVWSSLFFSSEGNPGQGWLERRQREDYYPDEFIARMASADLSAAMAAWALAVPSTKALPEQAGHALSQVLAVARLPWLWKFGGNKQISEELVDILLNTEENFSSIEIDAIEKAWLHLIRKGEAFSQLEMILKDQSPVHIRDRVAQDQISRGELLWQGNSGYCVALEDCQRSERKNISVLKLQGSKKDVQFESTYLIPLRSLLDSQVLPAANHLGSEVRNAVLKLINEISGPFSTKIETST